MSKPALNTGLSSPEMSEMCQEKCTFRKLRKVHFSDHQKVHFSDHQKVHFSAKTGQNQAKISPKLAKISPKGDTVGTRWWEDTRTRTTGCHQGPHHSAIPPCPGTTHPPTTGVLMHGRCHTARDRFTRLLSVTVRDRKYRTV